MGTEVDTPATGYEPDLSSEYVTGDQAAYWRLRRGARRLPSWEDVDGWRARWSQDLVTDVLEMLGKSATVEEISSTTGFQAMSVIDEFGHTRPVPDLRGFDVVLIPAESRRLLGKPDLSYAQLDGARLTDLDMEGVKLARANLRKATMRRTVLSHGDLTKADVSDADLRGARFDCTNLGFLRYTRDGLWWRGTVLMETSFASASYVDPVIERDAKDQYYIYAWKYRNRHKPAARFGLFLWHWSSNYGNSFFLFAGWAALIAVAYACIYYFALGPEAMHSGTDLPKTFWSMLYFSIITITTVGFGDIAPKSVAAACVVTSQVIIGYIVLGGLISIFANKVARRS